jgi:cell shape-determining protein MreC
MKTNFHLKSKPRGVNKLKIIAVVSLLCLLLFVSYFFRNGMRNFAYTVSRPVWSSSGFVTSGLKSFGSYFVTKNSLSKNNMALQDQIASLELKLVDYDAVQKQNEELKILINRPGTKDKVFSRVISKPPFSPYDTIVIDVGSTDGFVPGDRVYTSANVIIGSITEATSHTSLVTLYSSGGQKQEVVNMRTGATFELSGMGDANFRVEVPKDADIVWGDVFEKPSLNSAVVGSVYYIDTNSQSSFKNIYVRVPGNVYETKWVYVEKQ